MCYNYLDKEKMKEKNKRNEENARKIARLNNKDETILHAIEPIVEGIAKLFGSNCEVVLHSLADLQHSIIKIENGWITGRKVGFPLTDLGLKILKDVNSLESDITESYYTKTKDGKMLKSVTVLIRNAQGKPIGFLCINIDLSAPIFETLLSFLPTELTVNTPEHFVTNVYEMINDALDKVISEINKRESIPNSDKNKLIVFELYKKGIFNVKEAVDLIAQRIGVSRYTIYNYIREAKIKMKNA
jgi:predicted transcriptional regulator YheO